MECPQWDMSAILGGWKWFLAQQELDDVSLVAQLGGLRDVLSEPCRALLGASCHPARPVVANTATLAARASHGRRLPPLLAVQSGVIGAAGAWSVFRRVLQRA